VKNSGVLGETGSEAVKRGFSGEGALDKYDGNRVI
jgi:hypothetical protein